MFADCWQLPAPVRSPWHRHKTNRIPLPVLIISAFLLICCLCGTKQSCLTVKCLDIGHCHCCYRWENGKSQWPAINISVSAVFVFTSLLLWDSHLSYLASLLSFEIFCVSLSRLYFSIIPHSDIMIKTDCYFGGDWDFLPSSLHWQDRDKNSKFEEKILYHSVITSRDH